jgi:CRP/FNR family cyclic AMP-dependent transcriptional regulator
MVNKEMLSNFAIFSDVDQDELAEIAQGCGILEFKPNEVIFHQDEEAENLYGLLDGEVELIIMFKEKKLKTNIKYEKSLSTQEKTVERPIVFRTISPGKVFGWSSLVKPRIFTATARCSKKSQIFSLPASHLVAMFEKDAALGYLFMIRLSEIIAQRLRTRTKMLIEAWGEAFKVDRM